MKKPVIELKNIGKKYKLSRYKPTLIQNIFNLSKTSQFWALKNISLKINPGDKLGIIGNNGAGKTTLLKIISGITSPSEGNINVRGKVVSLIDLKAGFHPELTGRENILLNGMLLGIKKKKINQQLDKIISFSELEKFIDAPLYTYSNGMILRLGFSIAIHSTPEILVIDEILSVGDQNFQEKSFYALNNFFKKKTIIYTSHYLTRLLDFCNKVIWLEKGQMRLAGPAEKVITKYSQNNKRKLIYNKQNKLVSLLKKLKTGEKFKAEIQTNSMMPLIKPKTQITAFKEEFENLKVGDIILFSPRSNNIIAHRVVKIIRQKGHKYLITQGDNSWATDRQFVKKSNYLGKVII